MPLDLSAVRVEPLTDVHRRDRFRCSDKAIENFCRGGLAAAHRAHSLRAAVACEGALGDVLGFYYLTVTSIEHDAVDKVTGARLANVDLDKIPALYLGMIGVHRAFERQGIGTLLMRNAFMRVRDIARFAGVWALTLDAVNEDAVRYYERFDFRRFAPGKLEMYLPLGTIIDLDLAEEGAGAI